MFAHAEPGVTAIKADATKATVNDFIILFIVRPPHFGVVVTRADTGATVINADATKVTVNNLDTMFIVRPLM